MKLSFLDWMDRSTGDHSFGCAPGVEEVSLQECFLWLVGPEAGAQAWSERGLESVHRSFSEGSSPVVMQAFPICFAHDVDCPDGAISFD
jgi:hypothetical protein